MRLRYVKNAFDIINASPEICIQDPELHKGKWSELFPNKKGNLSLEIGCGKGQFLTELGKMNENEAYIGLEMMSSVICRAVQKIDENKITNVLLINKDGSNILDYFNEGEIDRLYLNFPDPWPKARHAKRRLTAPANLERYKKLANLCKQFGGYFLEEGLDIDLWCKCTYK